MAVQDMLTPELIESAARESFRRRLAVDKTRTILARGVPRHIYGLGYMDGVAALAPVIDQLKAQLQELGAKS